MINASSYSELLTEQILDRLSLILRRYSEGLMRLLESPLPGKLGGMKGRTLCLLTRCGTAKLFPSSDSEARVITVRSEQELLSLLVAAKS